MLSPRVRHPLTTTLIVVLSWREQTDMGQICAALSLMFLHNIGISIVCKVWCRLFSSLKQLPSQSLGQKVLLCLLSLFYCRHAPCWSILTQVTLSIDQYVVSQHRSVVLTTGSCPGQQWQSDEDNKTELTLHSSHCHCHTFLSYGNSSRIHSGDGSDRWETPTFKSFYGSLL